MRTAPIREKAPGERDPISTHFQADEATFIVAADPSQIGDAPATLTEADAHATVSNHLAVFVITRDRLGNTRRRTFLALSSAQKAVDRAHARGANARLILVRLHAVRGDL